jgi:mannose/fructose/N-acetylgalactosamine-specific phosphotransferase system component IIB
VKFDTLLVIDNVSAKDDFLTKTLYMAAPAGIKTFVMTVDQALGVLCDPRCKDRHIFAVVRKLDEMYEIASKAPDIVEINIANYGKLVPAKNPRKNYTENLFLDEEEHAILQKIADLGIPANMQMTPTSEKVDLKKVL